ncbi:aromatase/cyclase [Streptomyces sp. NPDC057445]|uniref:aromatase/cyclase n=1 Tax=Streptomyces sp. NPDC057445 TaxID=3346136 RepID=UPI0036CBEEAE
MTEPCRTRRTVHETEVAAPAGVVYGLIADAARWPLCFPADVYVERLRFDGVSERLRRWTTDGGAVTAVTLGRVLDASRRRVEFRQESPAAPLTATSGSWTVDALGTDRARLTLRQEFTAGGALTGDTGRAAEAVGRAESAHLTRLAESWDRLDELVLSFQDSVRVEAPPQRVYDFLEQAGRWPDRLPHVARLDLAEAGEGVQVMTTQTLTPDGAAYTTESVRVCFPGRYRIAHKQIRTPAALTSAHTGVWTVTGDASGSTVTSRHGVVLRPGAVTGVLGPDATPATARRHLREALGRESTATMEYAKRYAEAAQKSSAR